VSALDAVVIGSGFGGSIAALRLAEAGKRVLVLERGRIWKPEDFPRDLRDTDTVFWRWRDGSGSRGLYDLRFFSALGAVVASGVGGGSLVYANIHIRPDPRIFEDPRWPAEIKRATLDPYYDKVAAMLGVAPLPVSTVLPKRDRFRAAAAALGKDVFDPDEAVSWNACQLVAECEFGCRHGAKNTLDRTYLAQAQAKGAVIAPNSAVESIRPAGNGYALVCRDTETGRRQTLEAPLVVVAAGTLGTNELLMRNRPNLPGLSARLGQGYSANGDFLGSIASSRFDLEPWHGPDVTSVIKFFDEAPEFTMAAPTFNQITMQLLAAMSGGNTDRLKWAQGLIWRQLPWLVPLVCRLGIINRLAARGAPDAASRITNLFAIGRDSATGTAMLKHGKLDIKWDYAADNAALIARMSSAMQAVADHYGGIFNPLFSWNLFGRILTVHSLGGCHLSTDPARGVVSPRGAVHGYKGLYVVDGSVIPTSIGFHPCMTIAAVAERIAEGIVRES